MSTIKVNKIENTATANGGIAIDASGPVQIDGQQLPTAGAFYRPPLIINGAMNVAQRSTSVTGVANDSSEGFQTLDRFGIEFGNSAGGACTISQSTDVPSGEGFTNSYKVDVTTADTSLADSQMIYIRHGLEAQDVRNCGWDYTSTSSYVTVSFWVKSSKAGDYCFTVRALDVSGHFYYNHTVTLVANTWKKVTHSIPGHASLVFNNDNGLGLDLRWQLAMAANRNDATTDSWQSGSANTSTDIVNFFDSTSNEFYLTGVQMDVGEKSLPFPFMSYGDELARCERYFELIRASNNVVMGYAYAASSGAASLRYRTLKRAAPGTVTLATAGQSSGQLSFLTAGGSYPTTTGTHTVDSITADGFRIDSSGYSGLTDDSNSVLYITGEGTVAKVDAEL